MSVVNKYTCPHCGREIEEVRVIMLTWKRVLVSAGMGIGSALLIFPLVGAHAGVSAVGGFIVAFLVTFLVTKERR